MGQKINITESERKRIKGLYEDVESNNNFKVNDIVTMQIYDYTFVVTDNYDARYSVRIKDGNTIEGIEMYGSDMEKQTRRGKVIDNSEQIKEYVEQKIKEGTLFRALPVTFEFDITNGKTRIPFYRRG